MLSQKILVVDDEDLIRKLVKDFLTKSGYEVIEAADGSEALDKFFADKDIALVILDIMMPKIDGLSCAKEIKNNSKTPIILLTAKDQERDELKGFEIGVDEYISKPFSPKVLVARVEALLRRTYPNAESDILTAGAIVIDRIAHSVIIEGLEVELSFKEFELLTYFVENEGTALSRDKILDSVWSFDYFGDARTVDTHVKKLRAKMGSCGTMIKTIRGVGYKFETKEA